MNDNFTHQQESFTIHDVNTAPQKKGCGCGTAIACFVGLVVAIIATIWIVIMHTAIPLRYVADLIQDVGKGSNLKLNDLSGSLSSGVSIKEVKWNDGEITDMRFRYNGIMDAISNDKLIIQEMHIGSAKIIWDSSKSEPEDSSTDPTSTTSTTSSSTTSGTSSDMPLKLFQIDRVSLNKIIIEDRATGKTINIPKIEWTGFRAKKGSEIELGDISANSDHLVIKTSDPVSADFQKRFEITLFPKLDDRILKPINIDALVGTKEGKDLMDIKAFDNSLHITSDINGKEQIVAKDVNLAEYIDAPLPNKLNAESTEVEEASGDSTFTMNKGSFLLGTKTFEIQPLTKTIVKDTTANFNLSAICRAGETEILFETPHKNDKQDASFNAKLTSTPAMSPENLMALIFHNQEFSALDKTQQEKLRKDMEWFSFAK